MKSQRGKLKFRSCKPYSINSNTSEYMCAMRCGLYSATKKMYGISLCNRTEHLLAGSLMSTSQLSHRHQARNTSNESALACRRMSSFLILFSVVGGIDNDAVEKTVSNESGSLGLFKSRTLYDGMFPHSERPQQYSRDRGILSYFPTFQLSTLRLGMWES